MSKLVVSGLEVSSGLIQSLWEKSSLSRLLLPSQGPPCLPPSLSVLLERVEVKEGLAPVVLPCWRLLTDCHTACCLGVPSALAVSALTAMDVTAGPFSEPRAGGLHSSLLPLLPNSASFWLHVRPDPRMPMRPPALGCPPEASAFHAALCWPQDHCLFFAWTCHPTVHLSCSCSVLLRTLSDGVSQLPLFHVERTAHISSALGSQLFPEVSMPSSSVPALGWVGAACGEGMGATLAA